ncbi:esterase/lipase family protein [Spirillospora sp. CA-128828]|uniref:esterase/lipase family protein n=1 Tax=Spirillospora sp. CA-128828 TaxID=3240033 RepID=UPI003D91CD4D
MVITVWRKAAFAAVGLVMTTGLTTAQIAAGATRVGGDSANTPVYLIKGYRQKVTDTGCASKWSSAVSAMRGWGWTGRFHRVGYYSTDNPKNCVRIAKGSNDTSIKDLGRKLAQNIYKNYSSKGQTVDIVAHSMGGLVARAAIAGYARREPGWPPKLLIQDVVTLGTPHKGAVLPTFCTSGRQCREMSGTSSFLSWLGPQVPQADGGTDWTLLATDRDEAVNSSSAAPALIGAQHRVRYAPSAGLRHSDLRTRVSGHYRLNYSLNDANWKHVRNGAPPVRVAMEAIYWSSKW